MLTTKSLLDKKSLENYYHSLTLLGKGAYSRVYSAISKSSEQKVAIKILKFKEIN